MKIYIQYEARADCWVWGIFEQLDGNTRVNYTGESTTRDQARKQLAKYKRQIQQEIKHETHARRIQRRTFSER